MGTRTWPQCHKRVSSVSVTTVRSLSVTSFKKRFVESALEDDLNNNKVLDATDKCHVLRREFLLCCVIG